MWLQIVPKLQRSLVIDFLKKKGPMILLLAAAAQTVTFGEYSDRATHK